MMRSLTSCLLVASLLFLQVSSYDQSGGLSTGARMNHTIDCDTCNVCTFTDEAGNPVQRCSDILRFKVEDEFRLTAPAVPIESEEFYLGAAMAGSLLPSALREFLLRYTEKPSIVPGGAVLIQDLPLGPIPATPVNHSFVATSGKSNDTEFLQLTIGRVLGHPAGYLPENGGALVQNVFPLEEFADAQTSLSSKARLEYHTETAFHPFRSRFSVLTCLTGEEGARTYVSSIFDILPLLSSTTIATLRQKWFRTGIDQSFLLSTGTEIDRADEAQKTEPMAVLSGSDEFPVVVYDEDLMVGENPVATAALEEFFQAAVKVQKYVELQRGDMIIIDNHAAVHGRGSFTSSFGPGKRWLQRMFVFAELYSSGPWRDGYVINMMFGPSSKGKDDKVVA